MTAPLVGSGVLLGWLETRRRLKKDGHSKRTRKRHLIEMRERTDEHIENEEAGTCATKILTQQPRMKVIAEKLDSTLT